MYTAHPSAALNALFIQRPYQGAEPDEATFLFVGLDANYDESLDRKPIFSRVREYHEDGVAFWRRHGVHHPFLPPQYSGDGRRYHRNFAQIGFTPDQARHVSFIELLHVPTVGRNELVPGDFSTPHLTMLNNVLLYGRAKHIFVPDRVARLMRTLKAFARLAKTPLDCVGPLGVLYRRADKRVYKHLHFSVYGAFEMRRVDEAAAIRNLICEAGSP
jgi:hypothetical protein